MAWVQLCRLDQLQEGIGRYVAAGGRQLAVFLHQGEIHVFDNRCPHAGGSLSGGEIQEGCVVCPWHYWAFDLRSGKLRGAEHVRIRIYRTRLHEAHGQPTMVQAELPEG